MIGVTAMEKDAESVEEAIKPVIPTKRKGKETKRGRKALKIEPQLQRALKHPAFQHGDRVFAQVKGFPFWPAMVISDQQLPPDATGVKAKIMERDPRFRYNVIFYDDFSYQFLVIQDVVPYNENLELMRAKKTGGKPFKKALEQSESDPEIALKFNAQHNDEQRMTTKTDELEPETYSSVENIEPQDKKDVASTLKRIRFVLQRTFIKNKTGEMPKLDVSVKWKTVRAVLDEIKKYISSNEFDFEEFKQSRIPKILLNINDIKYDDDVMTVMIANDIPSRVSALLTLIKDQ